jgi:hypothetical protein
MPRWFARDSDGYLGVFISEHLIPDAVADVPEEDLDLTLELSRVLRLEMRPVRGVHAQVRGGELQMIASAVRLQRYATRVEMVTDEVIVARFARPQRGSSASFMPGIRTFGTDKAEKPSELERAHADGVCLGCIVDRAAEDLDEERLHGLGLFVYECDETVEVLHRGLVPSAPLVVARIGKLADRCLRYSGRFSTAEQLPMRTLERAGP